MQEYQLLEIIAIGFTFALIFGFITQKFGLSSIVGYLLAGFLIGPFSLVPLTFAANSNLALQLSETGIIFLMFEVGLHFKIDDLIAVKGIAIPGAVIQSTITTVVGTFAGIMLGTDLISGLILGLGLAVASTVVLLKILNNNDIFNTIQGHAAVGWLVVEDILTVFILVILPNLPAILSDSTSAAAGIFKPLGITLFRLILLSLLIVKVGGRFVPWLLSKVVKTRSQELFTLTVLAIAFATAVLAAFAFKTSLALGAFLGGLIVGKSKLSHQAGVDILPLRDTFAILFFLSVGMLLNLKFIVEHTAFICACLAVVLFIKPLTALFTVSILGYSTKTALTVAVGLSQIGEFSLILAQEAKRLGFSKEDDIVYNAIVVCSIVSITLNPLIFKKIPKMEKFLRSKKKLWNILNFAADRKGNKNKDKNIAKNLLPSEEYLSQKTAIVVGYGPTGKKVTQTLIKQGVKPIIIEINIDTVNSLSSQRQVVIYGDSTKRDILLAAGIKNADYLIITLPHLSATLETASLATVLNPKTRILARTRFLDSGESLKQAGVSGIAFEEEEVSNALTSLLLDDLEEQSLLATASELAAQPTAANETQK
ncbi:MAG: cation:proton antiporter [Endomicrobium sp.]|jgi:CPA2 family monovalent cation:H+ antiporter-2|nr:cation:proton antiporter [Endomicrobium sp.]